MNKNINLLIFKKNRNNVNEAALNIATSDKG